MDKFADMDLFVRIVRSGGLAAAGREIGLSPAAVSARINALEKRYETRLLNRTTRSVSMTQTGQSFFDASIRILADVEEVEGALISSQGQLAGPLRISAPSDLGQQHVGPVLSKLCNEYRGIIPHLSLTDGLINLTDQNIDVAIRFGEPADSTLIAKRLCTNHRVLCASPAYLKQYGMPKKPIDLQQHDCLAMVRAAEPLTTWYLRNDDEEHAIPIKPHRSTNDGALIRQWAVDGLGITLKSYIDVADDLKHQRLQPVLKNYTPDFVHRSTTQSPDLFAMYPTRQYVPERVRVFLDVLGTYFQSYND